MSALLRCSLLVVLGIFAGCSSDSKDSAYSIETAIAYGGCFLGLTTGGVKYNSYECVGTHTESMVSGLGSHWDEIMLTVGIVLNTPPALGKLDVESMLVAIPGGPDGDKWNVPHGACTFTAPKSFLDEPMDRTYYRIDVACSAPATPAEDNPGKPLELGKFSMVTFFTNP